MSKQYKVIVDRVDKNTWEDYAAEFADYSIYQSWAYQQVRCESDCQEISRIIIKDRTGRVVTMAQVRIKRCDWLGLRVGYIQWGPLFRKNDGTVHCTARALRVLAGAYLDTKVNVLRMVPNVRADGLGGELTSMLGKGGYRMVPAIEPYYTMMLEVDADDEELRSRFHRSWRRGLNKAEQAGIEIKQSRDGQAFEVLEDIYLEAKKRKGFKGLDPAEFVRTQQLLLPRQKMNIITAFHRGRAIAAHASSHFGDTAVGALAASTPEGLELGASYLLWWRTLLAARKAGMKRYDLGGIDPKKNPSVYQFKTRMGAKECCYIGAFEMCTSGRVRRIWRAAEKMYRLIKK